MRYKGLLALALAVSQPAMAADYALFGPQSFSPPQANSAATAQIAARVVERARQALSRPPAPLAAIHVEGTLPGQGTPGAREALNQWAMARDLALAMAAYRGSLLSDPGGEIPDRVGDDLPAIVQPDR